jgi:protein-disulfide isomerase
MPHELTHKKIYAVFVPAILLGALALFVQILRYEPLLPKPVETDNTQAGAPFIIPILPTDPIVGNVQAAHTIIAFEDFSCGACKSQHDLFIELQKKHPSKVNIIWKGLPVNDFPYPSLNAIRYGFCAAEQDKFNEFTSLAFANSNNLSESILNILSEEIMLDSEDLTECLASPRPDKYVEINKGIAQTLNVQSVPTFFRDNIQIANPKSIEEWEILLNL